MTQHVRINNENSKKLHFKTYGGFGKIGAAVPLHCVPLLPDDVPIDMDIGEEESDDAVADDRVADEAEELPDLNNNFIHVANTEWKQQRATIGTPRYELYTTVYP